jgi:hypothetical protein
MNAGDELTIILLLPNCRTAISEAATRRCGDTWFGSQFSSLEKKLAGRLSVGFDGAEFDCI